MQPKRQKYSVTVYISTFFNRHPWSVTHFVCSCSYQPHVTFCLSCFVQSLKKDVEIAWCKNKLLWQNVTKKHIHIVDVKHCGEIIQFQCRDRSNNININNTVAFWLLGLTDVWYYVKYLTLNSCHEVVIVSMQGNWVLKKQADCDHVFINNNSQTVLLQFLISVQLKKIITLRFLSFFTSI